MSALVESMAWTGDVPWHGLGVEVSPDLTPDEMLKKAGLDWRVTQVPLFAQFGGNLIEVPGKLGLQRETDGSILSVTSQKWNPVQNEDAFDFFSRFTAEGKMRMETAGSLDYGKYIWALARIDKNFKLPGKDEVLAHLLLMQPHVVGKAMVIDFTSTRVVCWNTLNAALGSRLRGSASAFRMTHLQKFDADMKKQAELALGLAIEQFEVFQEQAEFLASKKVETDDKLVEFFDNVVSFDRAKAKAEAEKAGREAEKEKAIVTKFRAAWEDSPGIKLPSANGTWWGALNAVTYVVDHHSGLTDDTRMKGAWLGDGKNQKNRALDLALEYAKAA